MIKRQNKRFLGRRVLLATVSAATVLAPFSSQAAETLADAVSDGKVFVDFRYRIENVDQDGFDEDATASLLRTRLNLQSAPLNGFVASLEIDNVTSIGADDYNSTENGNTEFPTIADPEYTEANQAWIAYNADTVSLKLGRQRIQHLTWRFIGAKPWRQNELTYDGLRLDWKASDTLNFDLSYVNNVNQIFGPDDGANPADLEGDYYFFLSNYQLAPDHELSGFAYLFDVDAQADFSAAKTVNNSSDTFGFQYKGSVESLDLRASYAVQSDAGRSELDYNADYYLLEASTKLGPVRVKAGYEVLGSDNNVGFATPFAAAHGVQGWADKFLGTPGDGIKDANLSIGGKLGEVNLLAVYHDFSADASSADFGTEVDLRAIWSPKKQLRLELKYADFSSDAPDRYDDTRKIWLTLQYKLP